MKRIICASFGAVTSVFTTLFGGWSTGMNTLVIFMAIDYIMGLIVAAVFKKSQKSASGGLQSIAGWKGLCRKGCTFLIVLLAHRLDIMINTNYIRDLVIIAFCANEAISIVENAGLMGIPMPAVITRAIDMLQNKADSKVDIESDDGEGEDE